MASVLLLGLDRSQLSCLQDATQSASRTMFAGRRRLRTVSRYPPIQIQRWITCPCARFTLDVVSGWQDMTARVSGTSAALKNVSRTVMHAQNFASAPESAMRSHTGHRIECAFRSTFQLAVHELPCPARTAMLTTCSCALSSWPAGHGWRGMTKGALTLNPAR